MSNHKRIAVIGMGPVGMILAVHLQEAGCEVAVCDIDKPKMDLIRSEGIFLKNTINKHAQFKHICTSVKELEALRLNILIFCVKSHHTPAVLKDITHLKGKIMVVSAQNGIDTEHMLSDVFGKSHTFRMIINYAGGLMAPNVANVTFFNPPNYIASIDDSQTEVAKLLEQYLTPVGLDTKAIDAKELYKREWQKGILNSSMSALCGVTHLTMKEVMDNPETLEIVRQAIVESVDVAEAEGIHFADNFVDTCMGYLGKAGHHFPSLADDLINNRRTEIDYFNGKIVEHGIKAGVPTPLNLSFTNMVKAMTLKNLAKVVSANKDLQDDTKVLVKQAGSQKEKCYLGIDLGSAFIKFSVIDNKSNVLYQSIRPTMSRDNAALKEAIAAIHNDYTIQYSCATGYGRKHFTDADMIKTEINCAAVAASHYFSGAKNIIDIGGEDIKIIKCDEDNKVESFYLNSKCAAGTGSFITEVAERAEISVSEMSKLASQSDFKKELNSFCTVFAKTEIMGWLFDGIPIEDIAKGIYISIANRVSKLRIDTSVPIYLIGGVIAHHPFLKKILEENLKQDVNVIDNPQHLISYGAALIAKNQFNNIAINREPIAT